jgi:hypothetical protein
MQISMYLITGLFSLFWLCIIRIMKTFPQLTHLYRINQIKKRQTGNSTGKCSVYMHTMLLIIIINMPICHNFYRTLTQQQPNESANQLHVAVYLTSYNSLTFICPHIASISLNTINKMQPSLDLFISIHCSICFRRFVSPSSGAQNCTYSIRLLSNQYCCLLAAGSSIYLTELIFPHFLTWLLHKWKFWIPWLIPPLPVLSQVMPMDPPI